MVSRWCHGSGLDVASMRVAGGGRERSGRPSARRGALARRLDPLEPTSAASGGTRHSWNQTQALGGGLSQ